MEPEVPTPDNTVAEAVTAPIEPEKPQILRVFAVARHLQVTTNDILELLGARGWDASRRAMQPISEDMYVDIIDRFRPDLFARFKYERAGLNIGINPRLAGISGVSAGASPKSDIFLPANTFFAPSVPRTQPIVKVEPVKAAKPVSVDESAPKRVRRKRESAQVRIIIRRGDIVAQKREALKPVSLLFRPAHSVDNEVRLNLKLNNIDLELISRIVNMNDRSKLNLIEELMNLNQ